MTPGNGWSFRLTRMDTLVAISILDGVVVSGKAQPWLQTTAGQSTKSQESLGLSTDDINDKSRAPWRQ